MVSPVHGPRLRQALIRASGDGALVISEIVAAELGAHFATAEQLREVLVTVAVELSPSDIETAHAAGRAFREYRRRAGQRERVLADFLVGAHALHHADALLTRDRGYYRTYFPGLPVVEP